MALIACKECGTEISDSAKTCVKCGAPVPKKSHQVGTILAIALLLGFIAFLIHSFIPSSSAPAPETVAVPAVTAADNAEASAAVAAPPVITHNYVYEENGEYGYEQALSDDDKKAGTATKPMLMARYRGTRDGTIRFDVSLGGGVTQIVSCKDPCGFAKMIPTVNGYQGAAQTIRVTDGSILAGIVQDILLDQLRPYGTKSKAKSQDGTSCAETQPDGTNVPIDCTTGAHT